MSRVPSDERVQTNARQIEEHSDAVSKKPHFAAFGMAPSHRCFTNLQSLPLCQKQQLRIESKPQCCLSLECGTRSLAMKQFESTLSIAQAQTEKQTNHKIEHHPADLAESGLMFFNASAIDVSRTNDDIRVFADRDVEQFVQFFNRRGKIRIRKQNIFTGCGQNTLANRVTFPVIFVIPDKAQAFDPQPLDGFRRLVNGSVIYNDQFQRHRRFTGKTI